MTVSSQCGHNGKQFREELEEEKPEGAWPFGGWMVRAVAPNECVAPNDSPVFSFALEISLASVLCWGWAWELELQLQLELEQRQLGRATCGYLTETSHF
ncbi:hypothetical protein ACLKA6_015414 [Drosophila palustris]